MVSMSDARFRFLYEVLKHFPPYNGIQVNYQWYKVLGSIWTAIILGKKKKHTFYLVWPLNVTNISFNFPYDLSRNE